MTWETPELDRQKAVIDSGAAEVISEFYDWLSGAGYVIARYEPIDGYMDPALVPAAVQPEQLMAQHFGIDLHKIEQERRAILDSLREEQGL